MKKTLVVAGVVALLTGPAAAQLESPLFSKVQPNIVNPGGKSLAMGGAFVSVADDATAAFANPAGLTQLSSWQVGASGKTFIFEPSLSTQNYLSTSPTAPFTRDTLDVYRPKDQTYDLEFASVVGPVTSNISVALYRAVNLRFRLDSSDIRVTGQAERQEGYRAFFINSGGTDGISFDEQGGLDLRNEMYGGAVAARFGPLNVGGSVNVNKLRFDLLGDGTRNRHTFTVNDVNRGIAQTSYPTIDADVTASTSGSKVGWSVGIRYDLWEASRVSIGAVYRKSPTFDIDYSVRATRALDNRVVADFACGRDDTVNQVSGSSACGTFHVPDDFSIGISGNVFTQDLLIALEVQRVRYSQLNDGFVPLFAYVVGGQRYVSSGESDDGTLYRAGAEYTFTLGTTILNLRAGYYREPAHGMKIQLYPDADRDRRPDPGSTAANLTSPPYTDAFATSFDGGKAENHISFGVGVSIARHLSIDVAFDTSPSSQQGVLSAFYRF